MHQRQIIGQVNREGTQSTPQTLPAITRTHTKRARTQIADRPEEQFNSVPSRALPPKGMPNGMILFILLNSKNRRGTSPEMAFPHLAYVGTREIAFLQPCARERRYFRGENCYVSPPDGLTAGQLRCKRAPWLHFAGYLPAKAGEFADKMNSNISLFDMQHTTLPKLLEQ